ncbi:aminodeoxychorismate synthase component I [Pontibacillus litoralis]|uniref:Chorismate-utilising enzyme C-terminal domain-containing protein n=1 Tax=Pontibacillus litoralis JSM 072002 TaxID=1385512 RepID=A0A0A5G8T6_9BACI|nr:aminodeoxychorismate synthase component I [Pontibacillus litoralis]KGX87588.1 hypothetical protein N784_15180 [Pontibacillus litoralis JSM 072002]
MKRKPWLQFDFHNRVWQFQHPVHTFVARSISEVRKVFQQIEQWIDEGYYIAGYVSYEAAPAFDSALRVHHQSSLPLVWFGVFEAPMKSMRTQQEKPFRLTDWTSEEDYAAYQIGIKSIKKAIEEGHTYQVNYTTRLQSTFEGDSFSFYKRLARNQDASYSAFLQLEDFSILSASPELFFHKEKDMLRTKPMKGTIKRGRYVEEDEQLASKLYQSEKDRAENVMIVDLLRNDVGRIAKPGSVHVSSLFDIERYPTVHQMTSTIVGQIDANISFTSIFEALFPCGSITGAPKVSTMNYIAALEQSSRDIYCGAIGFITPERDAVFNVPIRTVWIDHTTNKAVYGTGGGITWDSTTQDEYEEMYAKAKVLTEERPTFALLESMLLSEGAYPLMQFHMERLEQSAYYFNFTLQEEEIRQQLRNVSQQKNVGKWKVRLLMNKNGSTQIDVQEVTHVEKPAKYTLASFPVDCSHPFLYHKTTYRNVYDEHTTNKPSRALSVLLWNERNELTEFTIGNVVLEIDGKWLTPPITSGLLAGIYRKKLLQEGTIEEQVLTIDDLSNATSIWMINSVRGWVRMEQIEV